jgi:hypothetical protein
MGDYYGNASHQSPKQPQGGLDQGKLMAVRQHHALHSLNYKQRVFFTYMSFFLLCRENLCRWFIMANDRRVVEMAF